MTHWGSPPGPRSNDIVIETQYSVLIIYPPLLNVTQRGECDIEGRADDKDWHSDLYYNILTCIYGCSFGIAVFERLEQDDFNPNVAFEVGFMTALAKQVCLLKDKTLKGLHTDLIGKIYKTFDPQEPVNTIPPELTKWMQDRRIV